MEEAVKIAVRWKPIQSNDDKDNEVAVQKVAKNVIGVDEHTFVFDDVIDISSQSEIYADLVSPLVKKAIDGFNCTVLAYGQTGTGKTYTMGLVNNDNPEQNGITTRVIDDLFTHPNKDKIKVALSFIEIYNEQAFDLLSANPTKNFDVKGQKNRTGIKKPVQNSSDAQTVLTVCMKNRRVRQTKMNPNSSRSHGIVTIHVEVQHETKRTTAAINLVDLAGSEGVRRTSHKGAALLEGNHINQGLLCIGKVIKALSQKSRIIPYRDTVLTTVLQGSLNTSSHLTFLACITPFRKDCSETLSTLRFAAGAKTMKITPQLNVLITEYKKTKTPVKPSTSSNFRKTPLPLYLRNKQKELFKSPLPRPLLSQPRSHSTLQNRSLASKGPNFSSTSKLPQWSNRFSTPVTPNGNKPTPYNGNKSKASQNLFPEKKMGNMSGVSSNRDDSLESFAMNVSTSTAFGPDDLRPNNYGRQELPPGFSPLLNRFGRMMNERLAPIERTLQQSIMNVQSNENVPPVTGSSLRSIAEQMIKGIPKIEMDVSLPDDDSLGNHIIAPPSTPNTKNDNVSLPAPNQDAIVAEKENEFVVPSAVRPLNVEINLEQPQLRRSRRLSVMKERNEAQNDVSVNAGPSRIPTRSRKSKMFQLEKGLAEMTINPNKDLKSAHKDFVLNILNTGTMKDLQLLPTVGPKTAYQIYTYRLSEGNFETIESLKEMPFWKESQFNRFLLQNNLKLSTDVE